MTENSYFKIGNVNSPMTADLTNSTLQDCDPAIYYMMLFAKSVIEAHALDRWNAVVNTIGLEHLEDGIVLNAIPYDPIPEFENAAYQLPLLAVYRKSETYKHRSEVWMYIEAEIDVLYMLPTLTAGQVEVMTPFLSYLTKILSDRFRYGRDDNVGLTNYWTLSGIESITLSSADYGKVPSLKNNGSFFNSVVINLNITERQAIATSNYELYSGYDGYIIDNEFFEVDIRE